jgi:hypothetical protein
MVGKRKLLHSIHHLLIGIALILKGLSKFAHHQVLGGLIICFGLIILSYFIYLSIKRKESRTMHILIHLFEGFASLFTAYIFFVEGKKYLQHGFMLAAIGFFISVYVYIMRHKGPKAIKK